MKPIDHNRFAKCVLRTTSLVLAHLFAFAFVWTLQSARCDATTTGPADSQVAVAGSLNNTAFEPQQAISGIGTIRYINIEGENYVIDTANGTYYPLGLDAAYKIDGLIVSFSGYLRPDIFTTCMCGVPLQITVISIYGPQPTTTPKTSFMENGRMLAYVGALGHIFGEKSGRPVYPAGSSFESVQTGEEFYNKQAVHNLRVDYNVQVVRAVMSSTPWIVEYYDILYKHVKDVVESAIAEQIYVVVTRESAGPTADDLADAKRFYGNIARLYGANANIIYEIGLGLPNSSVESQNYVNEVLAEIRRYDAKNLVLLEWALPAGTVPVKSLQLNDTNWAYAIRYYPGSSEVQSLIQGGFPPFPVFVTEWAAQGELAKKFVDWMEMGGVPNCSMMVGNIKSDNIGYFKTGNTNFSGPWFDSELTAQGKELLILTQTWSGNEAGEAFMYTPPCTIEAERVASSSAYVTPTDDIGGGAHVFGASCRMPVYIPNPGKYKFTYRVKSFSGVNSLYLAYVPYTHPALPVMPIALGDIKEPYSGAWSAWTDVDQIVELSGMCILYVNFGINAPGLALNRFAIAPVVPTSPPPVPPRISSIDKQYMVAGSQLPGLQFTVTDDDTPASSLVVTAKSSNSSLLSDDNIQIINGDGAKRVLMLSPVAGQSGQTNISLTVTDTTGLTSTTTFMLVVMAGPPCVDKNGDGVSDIWASYYGMVGGPDDDPDGDGQTNRQEAEAGTDPNNPESKLTCSLARHDDGSLWLTFPHDSGKWYRIETSTDLQHWIIQTPIRVLDTDTNTCQVTAAGAADTEKCFWRVVPLDYTIDGSGLNAWEISHSPSVSILATAGPNGSISPSGLIKAFSGQSLVFHIQPNLGYTVDRILVDGLPLYPHIPVVGPAVNATQNANISAVGPYDYMVRLPGFVSGNHTINATFTLLPLVNLALHKPVTVSSTQQGYPAINAVDGDPNTRWSSDFSDPQWIVIDLGTSCLVEKIELLWEVAYAQSYAIDYSNDNYFWSTIAKITNGDGGVDTINCNVTSRYIRIYCTRRATSWGVSLYEVRVNGRPFYDDPRFILLTQTN